MIPGENQPTITVNLNQAGNYSFSAKAVVGDCNTSEASNEVSVTVYDVPTVTITGTHELAEGQTTATLTVSVLPEDGSYIYSWSNGTEGPEATSITVEQAGVYNVTVTYGNNCKVSFFAGSIITREKGFVKRRTTQNRRKRNSPGQVGESGAADRTALALFKKK